jgi:hypothetical protein
MPCVTSLTWGTSTTPGGDAWLTRDRNHINSVAYNPELDQIMLSVREYCEVWIIDHGTTTAEAASHKGGKRGKGEGAPQPLRAFRAYRYGSTYPGLVGKDLTPGPTIEQMETKGPPVQRAG